MTVNEWLDAIETSDSQQEAAIIALHAWRQHSSRFSCEKRWVKWFVANRAYFEEGGDWEKVREEIMQ